MIDAFEKETPSAFARIVCAAEGLKKGFPVRLCFDPMLYLPSWKTDYLQLLSQIDRIFGERMLHDGIDGFGCVIRHYGFAFEGKKVLIGE